MPRRPRVAASLLAVALLGPFRAGAAAQDGLAPAPAAAAPGSTTVRVEAEGSESAAPDRAVIDVGVRSEGRDAAAAAARNASTLDAVLAALRPVVGPDGSLETSGYSVQPRWESPPPSAGEPRASGYVVRNTVRATVADLGRVSRVIDAALAAGANESYGLAWTLGDEQPARRRALRHAVAAAQAKAQAVASELGMRLVRVVAVVEGPAGPRPLPFERSAVAAAAEVATPVEPARLTFRTTVTLTAELAGR
jgi:uncharacterized protein YggE